MLVIIPHRTYSCIDGYKCLSRHTISPSPTLLLSRSLPVFIHLCAFARIFPPSRNRARVSCLARVYIHPCMFLTPKQLALCSKTVEAARSLSQQFLERSIQKRYRAVVIGLVSEPGEMQGDVDGKDAFSVYSPVRSSRSLKFGWLTLLDLWPRTGRRHQLRIHLASRGTPIAGDQTYGMWMKRLKGGHGSWAPMQMGEGEPGMKVDGHELPFNRRPDVGPPDAGEGWDVAHTAVLQRKGMLLWASEVVLQHPLDGREMRISAPESKKFGEVMSKEQSRWDRLGEQA